MNLDTAISLEGVSKNYGSVEAIRDFSLSIAKGTTVAILGPNGAGKSTLLNILLGSLRPTQGQVSVFGEEAGSNSVRLRSGAMLQVTGVPETLTVKEHIQLFRSYYISPMQFEEIVHVAKLEGLERRRYGTLSGGEKQKLHFALAIAGNPDLLFLDEPTTAMDLETRMSLWDQISKFAKEKRTLVLNTHNLEEAELLANRIVLVDKGKILADAPPRDIRSLVGTTMVSARTKLDLETLAQLPGVMRIEMTDNRVRLFVNAPEQITRKWLNLDPDLANLEVTPAQLQDAYLHLVTRDVK